MRPSQDHQILHVQMVQINLAMSCGKCIVLQECIPVGMGVSAGESVTENPSLLLFGQNDIHM